MPMDKRFFGFVIDFLIPLFLHKAIAGSIAFSQIYLKHQIFIAVFIQSFLIIKKLLDAIFSEYGERLYREPFYAGFSIILPLFCSYRRILILADLEMIWVSAIAIKDNTLFYFIWLSSYVFWYLTND